MSRLKFIISLCVSISLILGQLSCLNYTYASELKEDFRARHRQGRKPASVSLDTTYEKDIEKANFQLLREQFREENKVKLGTFICHGMACFALLSSYIMLWNIKHTPSGTICFKII